MKKSIKSAAAVLLASVLLISCGTEKKSDTLRVNMLSEPDSFFPWKSAAAETEAVWDNIYEGLLKFDSKCAIYPALAESYTISDDYLTYTFKLRKGVKFHNGEEFSAKDCVYTYKNLAGLDGLQPRSESFSIVKNVYSPDEDTFVIELKKSSGSFLFLVATNPILLHDYDENETKPNGTGPYKFVSYSLNEKIVLTRNDDYYDKERAGKIKNIEIYIMTDENSSISALRSGQLDIIQRTTGANAKMLAGKYNVISYPENTVYILGFNLTYPPLSDINVRRAITCAINKKEIIDGVFDGFATELYSNFSPILSDYYNDQLKDVFPYDLEKAKEYMAQSNYRDGFDLSITVPANNSARIDMAELISNMLKPLGINCTIIPVEWATWLDRVYTKLDHQSTIINFAGKIDAAEVLRRYRSDFTRNFTYLADPEFDETFQKAENAVDLTKRAEYFKKCQEILTRDCPAVFICDPGRNIVTKKNIAGYTPYPVYFYDFSKIYFVE